MSKKSARKNGSDNIPLVLRGWQLLIESYAMSYMQGVKEKETKADQDSTV